jgi:hypothetical protein
MSSCCATHVTVMLWDACRAEYVHVLCGSYRIKTFFTCVEIELVSISSLLTIFFFLCHHGVSTCRLFCVKSSDLNIVIMCYKFFIIHFFFFLYFGLIVVIIKSILNFFSILIIPSSRDGHRTINFFFDYHHFCCSLLLYNTHCAVRSYDHSCLNSWASVTS